MKPRPSWSERISAASERGLIGKILATLGVGVTLIGVALLLVLAAQAGILRPEIRVAGGSLLAAALLGGAVWLQRKENGRVGAIALAATGIAAAYLNVLAVTRIYDWLPITAGLAVAAVVAAGGLVVAYRWNSEQLGLLVVIPLIILAPVLTSGLDLTLIAFMIILAASTVWVQIRRDWVWLHIVRTAAAVLPLTGLLLIAPIGMSATAGWPLISAIAIVGVLGVVSALILLPYTALRTTHAIIAITTTIPVLLAGTAVSLAAASSLQLVTATLLIALIAGARLLPGVDDAVARIWAAGALVHILVAVAMLFEASALVPVLLGLALVTAAAAWRPSPTAVVWLGGACTFWVLGFLGFFAIAPPATLLSYSSADYFATAATPIAGLLATLGVLVLAISWHRFATTSEHLCADSVGTVGWLLGAAVGIYSITAMTVSTGVLLAGSDGFLGGHVAATICWVAAGASALAWAKHNSGTDRNALIAGGLGLIAAATGKLFLFDLSTLDGIFRVIVFIIVGLALLGLGSWYARTLQGATAQA